MNKNKKQAKNLHKLLHKPQNNDKITIINFNRGHKIMINIRPVSDLRNKYPEIEELVLKEDEAVYLTKNGYGSMVVMSLEKYAKLMSDAEYDEYVENALDEADRQAEDPNTKYLTKEEVFGKLRRKLNGG